MPHFSKKCVENNREGLFAKKECRKKAQRDAISNLRARGERQLKERLSDFERKGETFPPVWRKMQQARIIPKTYQREEYPAFSIAKDTIDYKRVKRVSNNSVTVWSEAKKFLNNIPGYCCEIDNFLGVVYNEC